MRVFVAGATGALGRPLVGALLAAGHDVTGTTRSPERAAVLRERGAAAAVLDAFDAIDVHAAVSAAQPEVVIHALTAIPADIDIRHYARTFAPTNRIREVATPILVDAARAAGARRIIAESIAFAGRPEGDWVYDEDHPLWTDAPEPFGPTMRAVAALEQTVLDAPGIEGVVLRYGQFYGPGTSYGPGGSMAGMARRRRLPLVGRATAHSSFIHVADAAAATVQALDHGAPGVYNIVDDEPARSTEWLPAFAAALGAKPPRHVPIVPARLLGGPAAIFFSLAMRGATNAKARRELDWRPRYASWREGFPAQFADDAA